MMFGLNLFFMSMLGVYFFSFFFVFFNKKNPFIILILLELQLILLCALFVYFSFLEYTTLGLIFSLFMIAFAGAEASVGMSILMVYYRVRGLFSIEYPVSLERI